MRILRIELDDDLVVDLHPRLSVVDADLEQRAAIRDIVASLGLGQVTHSGGLVEAQGVLLGLDPTLVEFLDLPGGLDPILRPDELPGVADGPAGRRRRRVEQELDDTRRTRRAAAARLAGAEEAVGLAQETLDQLASSQRADQLRRHAMLDDLAEADAIVESARAALDAVEDELARLQGLDREGMRADVEARLVGARENLAAAQREHDDAVAALEALIGDGVEPDVETEIRDLAELVESLEAERAVRGDSIPDAGAAAEDNAVAAAEHRIHEIEAELERLRAERPDPSPEFLDAVVRIEAALADQWTSQEPQGFEPQEMEVLADALDEVRVRLGEYEELGNDPQVAALRAQVDLVRAELKEMEGTTRPRQLDPDLVTELEAAHEAVLDAHERSEGLLGGRRAHKQLDEARQVEQEVLERCGFATYSDYMMSASIHLADPASTLRLETARREVEEAEAEMVELETQLGFPQDELAELRSRQEDLQARAARALSVDVDDLPDDVGAALREVATDDDATDLSGLRDALAVVGAELPPDDEDLVEVARQWRMDEERRLDDQERRIAEAETRLQAATADLGLLHRHGDDPEHADGTPWMTSVETTSESPELIDARRRLEELRGRSGSWGGGDELVARQHLAEAETGVAAARTRVDELEEALAALDPSAVETEVLAVEQRRADAAARLGEVLAQRDELRRELGVPASEPGEDDLTFGGGDQLDQGGGDQVPEQPEDPEDAARARVAQAEAELTEVTGEIAQLDNQIVALEADLVEAEQAALEEATTTAGVNIEVDEIEFYVLARIASLRSASFAGSVPLLVDDAFANLPVEDELRVMRRLERMTDSVQVVYLTTRKQMHDAVEAMGLARAAVVEPVPVGEAAAPIAGAEEAG